MAGLRPDVLVGRLRGVGAVPGGQHSLHSVQHQQPALPAQAVAQVAGRRGLGMASIGDYALYNTS